MMVCNFWVSLCILSFGFAEILTSAPDEPCLGVNCESRETLTEDFSNKCGAEQQNDNIPDKIAQNYAEDSTNTGVEIDNTVQSSCSLCNKGSNNQENDHLFEKISDEEILPEDFPSLEAVGIETLKRYKRHKGSPHLESLGAATDVNSATSEATDKIEQEAATPQLEVVGIDKADVDKSHNDHTLKTENIETHLEQPQPRQRYFPLLYTIRTLLTSLMADFGEDGTNQETSYNMSDIVTGNVTVSEDLNKDSNSTTNGTDSIKKTRFQCAVKNITFNSTGEVKIVNSTELLEMLNFSKNQKVSPCVLVMFHAPWCHFCARAAPHYNALARAFPQLDILAVDTSHFSYLNARFGTVAVPNLMLFHARSAVRFNHTARVLENFVQFVTNNTGIEPDMSVKLEPVDFLGPLPSVVVRGRDWLLWLSWTFVIICSAFGFVRSHYGQSLITWLRILWQEHQHIE